MKTQVNVFSLQNGIYYFQSSIGFVFQMKMSYGKKYKKEKKKKGKVVAIEGAKFWTLLLRS